MTIVGPTVLAAFLNSLQMGFKTLAIEQKSAEVWRLLGEVKAEFGRFSESVGSMEKRIDSVKSAISAMRTRTNVMERKLKGVESVYSSDTEDVYKRQLLRFASTRNTSDAQDVSLTDYIAKMPEKQKCIYYLVSGSYASAATSPYLESFKKKGIEVLLMLSLIHI